MKIVNTTHVFPAEWDICNMLDRMKNCGFDTLDFCFLDYTQTPEFQNDHENWAHFIREEADKRGICFTHAHASFWLLEEAKKAEKTFQVASILGVTKMVSHPNVNDWSKEKPGDVPYQHPYPAEEFIRLNAQSVKPLLELAEKYGVMILSENLLWGESAQATVQSDFVEYVNSPWFGWCYDVGHAIHTGDPLESLLKCKYPPVSLHTHDCLGKGEEDHYIPGDGVLDWKKFARILKEIGYTGDLVLEAMRQTRKADDKDRDTILRKLYRRAKTILDDYEQL
ncbi:MAG: sugar phosphate isomerase/epimerase [Clostridia bacterium]|nr:sugar phosphate isomerase/epimerase [Clostridia bacterium]